MENSDENRRRQLRREYRGEKVMQLSNRGGSVAADESVSKKKKRKKK